MGRQREQLDQPDYINVDLEAHRENIRNEMLNAADDTANDEEGGVIDYLSKYVEIDPSLDHKHTAQIDSHSQRTME